jgi:hypothetical protein
MDKGHFYFLDDQYFVDFNDPYLMQNKETIAGVQHGRPCFVAIQESADQIYWMIPISSQIMKFTAIYQQKISKFGVCDTIIFGDVLGRKKAFLIQNMCPTTSKYTKEEYLDSKSNLPVIVDRGFEKVLIQKAAKILALQRQGKKLIFPDVFKIEQELLKQIILS